MSRAVTTLRTQAPNLARTRNDGVHRRWRRCEPPHRPDVSTISGALASPVPLLATQPLHERPEWPRLLRGRVASLLSIAPRRWNRVGPRRQQGPRALGQPAGGDSATSRWQEHLFRQCRRRQRQHERFRDTRQSRDGRDLHGSGTGEPVASRRLQPRQRTDLHVLLRQPGHRHQVSPVSRSESVLARASQTLGDGRGHARRPSGGNLRLVGPQELGSPEQVGTAPTGRRPVRSARPVSAQRRWQPVATEVGDDHQHQPRRSLGWQPDRRLPW